jgi:hypothetical protein
MTRLAVKTMAPMAAAMKTDRIDMRWFPSRGES